MNLLVDGVKKKLEKLYVDRDRVWLEHYRLNNEINELELKLGGCCHE